MQRRGMMTGRLAGVDMGCKNVFMLLFAPKYKNLFLINY